MSLLTPKNLRDYQKECVLHILYNRDAMLWLQMGLGKTIVTLTALVELMNSSEVKKVLIFGPLRVITSVWQRECSKWEHTKHLKCSVVHGPPQKRTRALFAEADIFLCNYENMNWLAETLIHYYLSQKVPLPFDMVVYDEVSKLKSSTAMRMAGGTRERTDKWGGVHEIKVVGWRKLINKFKYRVGLTGTPASNGYKDLHGQFLAVDGGERLGLYKTHFEKSYFVSDYNGWSITPTENGIKIIQEKISDITMKMDAKDYLDMPETEETDIMVEMPPKALKAYKEMEAVMFTELESGHEIEVTNRASAYNKCLQFSNGTPYIGDSDKWEKLHDAKLDALADVLEEAAGRPVLCSYSFKSDAARIIQKFKKMKPINLTEEPASKTLKIIDDWNLGKIKLLIGHPASMGHGIDGLQESGSIIVWFGLNWSLELYEQMNWRLIRSGQKSTVSIIRILCKDSLDLAVADVIRNKADNQEGLKNAIQRYRDNGPDGPQINEPGYDFF